MKSFVRFIVYSNIFVAFCVLGLSIGSEILLDTANYKLSQFVFFATLFTYNFQRIVRLSKTREHARKDWLNKNKLAIFFIVVISAIMSAFRFFDFKTNTQIIIVISGIISVSYPFGLREIPFSKIFIISLVWTVSTMLLLVLENNISFDSNITLHLIGRFLFVLAITIPFDIRDIKFDKDTNLKTFWT